MPFSESKPDTGSVPPDLTSPLLPLLLEIRDNPLPPRYTDPPRRASVAVILRFSPPPSSSFPPPHLHTPSPHPLPRTIEEFFAQDWVEGGYAEPQVLLIKRAARKGDRWTSHVALPGGKRDKEDRGDEEAAVREVREEVGLKMGFPPGEGGERIGEDGQGVGWNCLRVGGLPERLVSTAWGRTPLMVLCPFVFIYLSPTPPTLTLQPTEVTSAHFLPLAHLLSPHSSTLTTCLVSERLSPSDLLSPLLGFLMTHTLGRMVFCGTSLSLPPPPESGASPGWGYYNTNSALDAGCEETLQEGGMSGRQGLVLWGLTHAVLFDILNCLPPQGEMVRQWRYPTFTALDVRGVIWAFGWGVRRRGVKEGKGSREGRKMLGEESVVHVIMDGYYASMRKAVWVGLGVRGVVLGGVVWWGLYRVLGMGSWMGSGMGSWMGSWTGRGRDL